MFRIRRLLFQSLGSVSPPCSHLLTPSQLSLASGSSRLTSSWLSHSRALESILPWDFLDSSRESCFEPITAHDVIGMCSRPAVGVVVGWRILKQEVLLPGQGYIKASSSSQLGRCFLINWRWWEYVTRQREAEERHGLWAFKN